MQPNTCIVHISILGEEGVKYTHTFNSNLTSDRIYLRLKAIHKTRYRFPQDPNEQVFTNQENSDQTVPRSNEIFLQS